MLICGMLVLALSGACSDDYSQAYDVISAQSATTQKPEAGSTPTRQAETESQTTVDAPSGVAGGCESAYDLGVKATQQMLENARTTNDIRNGLLDLRAREYSIRSQVGASAADAYINGIKSYLKEHSDTLYRTLF